MTDDRRLVHEPDPDEYTVDLFCVGAGCTDRQVTVTRWHRHDPYPVLPYRCPDCVSRAVGR